MGGSANALDGLVVIDVSTGLASAFTTMLFADFGAEVIQVERPGGSTLRAHPSAPFWMRGKKSIELDLLDPADAETAFALCAEADVVVESWRLGVADRLGLGDAALRAVNPGLVYTQISGFGPSEGWRDIPGYETIVQAKTGSMHGANPTGRPGPVMTNPQAATFSAGFLAMQGTLLALHERSRSGFGQRVDATLIQGLMSHDPWSYFAPHLVKTFPDAFSGVGRAASVASPAPTSWLGFGLTICQTKDGRWMQFAHATPRQYAAFVDELGLAWTRDDPELRNAADHEDAAVRERWWDLILESVRSKTTQEWQAIFDANKDCFAEIFREPHELFEHPQIVHDGSSQVIERRGLGPVREMGPLVQFDKTPGDGTKQAPELDEHAAELRSRPRRDLPTPSGEPGDRPALEDVLVLDLGTFYAGPFGSTMLTDHGARVIKIEPLEGDPIRFNMPFPEWGGIRVTQGKESVAVDFKSDEGMAIVRELVKRADIILHTYRGGVAERMGLDADTLFELNPTMNYHHGQGYGVDGPYCRRQAYAPTIAAGAGFSVYCGGGGPNDPSLSMDEMKALIPFLGGTQIGIPDGYAAMGVGVGLALALVARDRGHHGQKSMTTMLATMGHVMSDLLVEYDARGEQRQLDPGLHGFHALHRLYPAADDSWVVLCAPSEREWQALTAVIPALADAAAFATAEARAANDALLVDALGAAFAGRTAQEWEREMVPAGVACVSVVEDLGRLCAPVMYEGGLGQQLDMMTSVDHPIFGNHLRAKAMVHLARTSQTLGHGCGIGEHSASVLAELGYTAEQIADLRERKVIG